MGREKSKPVGCLSGMPMQLAGFGFMLSIVLQLDNSFWPWDNDTGMDAGRSNPDPAVQAKWAGFEYSGDEPTLEEFILWMAGQVR